MGKPEIALRHYRFNSGTTRGGKVIPLIRKGRFPMKAHEPELHRSVTVAELREASIKANNGGTPLAHGVGCWRHPEHWKCAVEEIRRLRAKLLANGVDPDQWDPLTQS